MTQLNTITWLFPILFMLHDFEEIILLEAWQKSCKQDLKNKKLKRIIFSNCNNTPRIFHRSSHRIPPYITDSPHNHPNPELLRLVCPLLCLHPTPYIALRHHFPLQTLRPRSNHRYPTPSH